MKEKKGIYLCTFQFPVSTKTFCGHFWDFQPLKVKLEYCGVDSGPCQPHSVCCLFHRKEP